MTNSENEVHLLQTSKMDLAINLTGVYDHLGYFKETKDNLYLKLYEQKDCEVRCFIYLHYSNTCQVTGCVQVWSILTAVCIQRPHLSRTLKTLVHQVC